MLIHKIRKILWLGYYQNTIAAGPMIFLTLLYYYSPHSKGGTPRYRYIKLLRYSSCIVKNGSKLSLKKNKKNKEDAGIFYRQHIYPFRGGTFSKQAALRSLNRLPG